MTNIDWYIDFLSPFAYLQSARIDALEAIRPVRCVPVLLAGLLNHWENKGPAEIVPKRRWTFEHVAWLAHENGIALRLPPAHPFNPLTLLRTSQALGNSMPVVQRIFRFVWSEGRDPDDPGQIDALLEELGTSREAIGRDEVKRAIRANTEAAVENGVFGVPTLRFDQRNFWGFDATRIALAALRGDPFFESPDWRAAAELPEGAARRRPPPR